MTREEAKRAREKKKRRGREKMQQLKQYSIFDTINKGKTGYGFKRYIGQKVRATFAKEILTVKEIEPYYTICIDKNGAEYAGINCTISPVNEEEWGNA